MVYQYDTDFAREKMEVATGKIRNILICYRNCEDLAIVVTLIISRAYFKINKCIR